MRTAVFRVLGLLLLLAAAGLCLAPFSAQAPAVGGGSLGGRGPRSFSSPSRPPLSSPRPQPRAPNMAPRQAAATPTSRPATPGPFWRSLAGGVVGGTLGALLFRGMGGPGAAVRGVGIGLLDLLFLAAVGYGIFWWVRRRRAEGGLPADAYFERRPGLGYYGPSLTRGVSAAQTPLFQDEGPQVGPAHIRQMDPRFDEAAVRELCMDHFFRIQAARMDREVDGVADLLTPEMQDEFRRQLEGLRREGRINRLECITLRAAEPTEARREDGQDHLTVCLRASLLDYTVDERSGQVVEGSRTEPVEFGEYWTWTRPAGPNPWRLSAIQPMD